MRKYLKQGNYSLDQSDLLGKGSFGRVYRGYDHKNERWVAIKAINLQLIEFAGEQMMTIVCGQISIMRKLADRMESKPCPYLVKHFDCFRTDTNVYLIMELCQGGTLSSFVEKQVLSQSDTKNIVKQVLEGLAYLEELSICHRDLKPENIFISSEMENGKTQVCYKLGDFGFSAQKQTFSQTLGTYPFMAPEIYNKQQYTTKIDVWSLGVITYQLLFQELYFFGKNKWQIQKKVKEMPFSIDADKKQKISKQMKSFLVSCLTKNQDQRPKASQLLQNPLFIVDEQKLTVIFEAIEHELLLSELLRSMAEEICDFGISTNRSTQFIQIYLLKKSFATNNLITYSLTNNQNYINISSEMFDVLMGEKHRKDLNDVLEKVEKENILITSIFQDKYKQFTQYIKKFKEDDIKAINNVIRAEEFYSDINRDIFKKELNKWMKVLENETQYQELKLKCEKLCEFM